MCLNFCLNPWESLWHWAFSSQGLQTWAMDCKKSWLLLIALSLLLLWFIWWTLCPYPGKQWIVIFYLPLHYQEFVDIIKVIYLPGSRVLVCLISFCMEAPHLNRPCYILCTFVTIYLHLYYNFCAPLLPLCTFSNSTVFSLHGGCVKVMHPIEDAVTI